MGEAQAGESGVGAPEEVATGTAVTRDSETRHTPSYDIPQVDPHSHLVPAVDDGARDEEMAVAMLRVAAADGTRIIAATPHADGSRPATIPDAVRRLNELAQEAEIPIEVVPGCEYKLTRYLGIYYKQGRLMTLNGKPYVLVELPDWNEWPRWVPRSLAALLEDGLWPVFAHPERHPPVQRNPELVLEAVQAGALVQINAGSLLGSNGREAQRVAVLLLRARAAHLIASDSHHPQDRPPCISAALERAAALAGDDYARWMRWAALQVVLGERVEVPQPDPEILRSDESWLDRVRDWLGTP